MTRELAVACANSAAMRAMFDRRSASTSVRPSMYRMTMMPGSQWTTSGDSPAACAADARRALAFAEDVVDRNVVTASRDVSLGAIDDEERRVGEPARQRFELHFATPARQGGDSRF
jgi:hypothetical protein